MRSFVNIIGHGNWNEGKLQVPIIHESLRMRAIRRRQIINTFLLILLWKLYKVHSTANFWLNLQMMASIRNYDVRRDSYVVRTSYKSSYCCCDPTCDDSGLRVPVLHCCRNHVSAQFCLRNLHHICFIVRDHSPICVMLEAEDVIHIT